MLNSKEIVRILSLSRRKESCLMHAKLLFSAAITPNEEP